MRNGRNMCSHVFRKVWKYILHPCTCLPVPCRFEFQCYLIALTRVGFN